MSTEPMTASTEAQTSRAFLEGLSVGYGPRDFAVRFWDGSTWEPEAGHEPGFTLVLRHPGALRAMFWPPNGVAFAEAYVYDDFDIEGDIFAFFRFVQHLLAQEPTVWQRLRQATQLLRLPKPARNHEGGPAPARMRGRKHSVERDRQAIAYHYDLSNEFFGLWLDRRMVYTCAYFGSPEQDLETAQERKLDLICRKLRLRPGERLLDIGCGWGALVMHAAQHYGVQALGITVSRCQVDLANERIRQAGLQDRCRVEFRDYREIDEPEAFDKMACVGMVEHLGESMMPILFGCAYRLLKPGGVFVNHGLTLPANKRYPRWTKFSRRYVFPDGELRPVASTILAAETAGFEIRDVEGLRDHYIITLTHWLRRLEAAQAKACSATSDQTYRIFRLYLAGAREGMRRGVYNVHQSLLAKPIDGRSGLPLTRDDWYQEPAGPSTNGQEPASRRRSGLEAPTA